MRYFTGSITYNAISGVIFGAETLEGALEEAFRSSSYYVALYGKPVTVDGIWSRCACCNGSGRVQKSLGWKKCPECKGKDSDLLVVGEFVVEFSGCITAKVE